MERVQEGPYRPRHRRGGRCYLPELQRHERQLPEHHLHHCLSALPAAHRHPHLGQHQPLEHEGAADKFEVVDESGKTAAELCSYIDAGMPVVFWATLDFQPVPEKRDHWLLADGTDFAWKCNEHCLLLVGYDDENYWFNDPWHDHGVCPQPKQLVEDCHAAQGLFAVTLRPKGEV